MRTDLQDIHLITGIILAGGQATRMQGRDKGLVELQGQPLIQHVIDRIQPQVAEIRINANRNLDDYRQFGFPVFSDANQDFQGPLSGMLQGLRQPKPQHSGSERSGWIVCVPCDAPLLPPDLVSRFCQSLGEKDYLAVADDGKWMQPTFCMLHRSLADSLEKYIAGGGRKTGDWLRQEDALRVDFSDQRPAFTNINSNQDLQQYPGKPV